MGNFYVYEHWRPDKDTCFWVGKGKGRRAYYFRRNSRYDRVIAKLARLGMCAEVRLVSESLSEKEAHLVERERIAFWRASGTSDLCNMTDGGEGVSGLRHSTKSKALMTAKALGRAASEATRKKMSTAQTGRRHRLESRAKLSAAKTGKPQGPHTPEHNAKIGAAVRGRVDPLETRLAKKEAALRRGPPSEAVKNKIAKSVKALWGDEAYRSRLIASHAKRPPPSEEAKAKMRASQQARRARELVGE